MGISDWSSDGALPICALIFKGYAAISNCVAEDFRARHGKCCSLQAQTEEAGFQAGVAVGDRKPPLGDAAGHRRRRNSFERLPRPAPQLGIDLPFLDAWWCSIWLARAARLCRWAEELSPYRL